MFVHARPAAAQGRPASSSQNRAAIVLHQRNHGPPVSMIRHTVVGSHDSGAATAAAIAPATMPAIRSFRHVTAAPTTAPTTAPTARAMRNPAPQARLMAGDCACPSCPIPISRPTTKPANADSAMTARSRPPLRFALNNDSKLAGSLSSSGMTPEYPDRRRNAAMRRAISAVAA